MVKLTEVEDEHFKEKPTSSKTDALLLSEDDDEDYTDTESEISTDSFDNNIDNETLYERLCALQDIVPAQTRYQIASTFSSLTSVAKSTASFGGSALWIVSTSVFLLGVPWALALSEEQQYVQMEREQGMIKGANEMLTPGATSALTAPDSLATGATKPAL